MTVALLADFINMVINTCIRNLDPFVKGILLICFVMAFIWCLSKVLKPKAKPDQNQISVFWLILTILFFILIALYIIF